MYTIHFERPFRHFINIYYVYILTYKQNTFLGPLRAQQKDIRTRKENKSGNPSTRIVIIYSWDNYLELASKKECRGTGPDQSE